MRADGMWKNSIHLGSTRRPLPGVLSTHRGPVPNRNKTYQQRHWIWTDQEVYLLDSGERLYDYLRAFYHVFMGEPTLYIIDDYSASTALTNTKDMFTMLAFSGRHAEQSVLALIQKYNSILKDLRDQTRLVCYCTKFCEIISNGIKVIEQTPFLY